jgi:hypothetical protein
VVDATISPNPIDLASKPSHFTVTGNGFADLGFGLPVANFYSGNSIVAQARATAGDATSLTLPFPTDETSIGGPRPGLTDGIFQVKIFNQTGSSSWLLVGSTELTVENSTGNDPSVDSIAPTSIDLASPPTEFTILGNGFDDFGFGLPVINFYSGSIVVAQARAADGDGNSLTVPFPNDATSLSGNHPGLAAGSYIVRVFNQTGPNAWFEVGTTGLTVSDTRPPIAPNPIDLAAPPPEFEITGTGFRDYGFGLPVTNFYSGGTVMAQARAIADNDISITVPFPTDHTSIGGPKPGLSAGVFIVRVFNQTGPNNWDLIVTTSLTVTDSSP